MKRIERFDKYMEVKHLKDNKVTVQAGLSVGSLGKSRKPNRDLSISNIEKILNFYTDLSREWLLTGKGEMLKEHSAIAENHSVSISGDEIRENNIHVNTDDTLAMLIAEMAAQRKMTEKILDQNTKILEQNSELIASLVSRVRTEDM